MNFREPKFDAEFVMTTFEYVDRTNLIVWLPKWNPYVTSQFISSRPAFNSWSADAICREQENNQIN